MRIYIAGKITGNPGAKQRFQELENSLLRGGHEPINPYKIGEIYPNLNHEEIMHLCFAAIDICDAVLLQDNWKESPGACQEYGYSLAKGKEVIFE